MANTFTVVVNQNTDERVIQELANFLRSNGDPAKQLRDFVDTVKNDPWPNGLLFQPRAGQILICHFGLGFREPEIVKTRPVLVVSAHLRENTGLCTVIPISSRPPKTERPYHFRLPDGTIPNNKYEHSWLKGDLVQTVGIHRLDRLKIGPRKYAAPKVSDHVLKEARRCILHSQGMHTLTDSW